MTDRMPVLFVGHGSPMNAIEMTPFAEGWRNVGQNLPRPCAILCISAHWQTHDLRITTNEHPETFYDIWGFPEELYDVIYPVPGSPSLANSIIRVFSKTPITPDPARGFVYVTIEPCLMCAWAIVLARLKRLVFGAPDPKSGACVSLYRVCEDARLNHRVEVAGGVREAEYRELLQEFFQGRRK